MGVCGTVHLGGHIGTGGWGMVAGSHVLLADRVKAFDIILENGSRHTLVRPTSPEIFRADLRDTFRQPLANPEEGDERTLDVQLKDDIYYAVLGG